MALVLKSCTLWQGRQLLPPAICLPGVVGVCHRGATEPARSPSEGAPKMWLPAALVTEADLKLFKSISTNPYHVLRHYFRQREPTGYSLRPRAHSFALPAKDDRNFIPCLLYGVLTQPNLTSLSATLSFASRLCNHYSELGFRLY